MADVDQALSRKGQPTIAATPTTDQPTLARCFVILLVVVLFTRLGEFNNPLTHVDDQFYLFTGKAMLNGALPYVDVWDRKPIGLFLIYEGIAALGGDSVIVYHLVAALAVLGTALVVMRLGERFAGRTAGLRAGIAYIALLPTMGGGGGQSPVFYNLLIALAALLTFDATVRADRGRWPAALGAMALCGLAIQVKPTTMFEGAFFAVLFLLAEWRETRRFTGVAALAAAMAAMAALPTLIAFGVYAMLGHAWDMWFATVVSIFNRTPLTLKERFGDVPQMLLFLGVPLLVTFSALVVQWRGNGRDRVTMFLAGWLAAAFVGFLSVPNFFNHYTLPLMLPMSVIMARLFADRRDGLLFALMVVAVPILIEAPTPKHLFERRSSFDRLAQTIHRDLHGGCLYIYYGPTYLYSAANACHLSPYVFPDHLETEVEAPALPVSPEAEVERIFAHKPAVVITGRRKFLTRNNRTAAIVERHLWCEYRLARHIKASSKRTLEMWTRRPDPLIPCPAAHPPLGIVQTSSS
ncbi:MAG: glycosyltransferase family 39 protein [Sphingomicrobium sp.]